MVDDLNELSDDDLRDALTTWAGRVAAGEARLVELVGELDERGAWAVHGVRSCAHWLTWRLGLGGNAARERVRVARSLRQLPVLAGAFGRGELAWSQVRAVTRVATPADDADLTELARRCTGAQLERLCRGIARAQRPQTDAADPEAAAWRRRPRVRYDDDGSVVLTLRLPAEQGQVVLAALEQQLAELEDVSAETPGPVHAIPDPRCPADDVSAETPAARAGEADDVSAETSSTAPPLTLADALVQLCSRVRVTDPVGRARLKVLLDPLTGWSRTADGELLPPGTVPSVLEPPVVPADLTAHDRGRDSRDVTPSLRALLGQVDGERCRFPGCRHVRFLHAHHVTFWSEGGPTDLANTLLLCSYHHGLVHREGYRLVLHADRRLTVTAPDGLLVPLPQLPLWQPVDDLDPYGAVTATTLPPQWDGSGLDLDHAVWGYLARAA